MKPVIKKLSLEIPVERVLRRLGYGKNRAQPRDKINRLLGEELEIARNSITTLGMFQDFPVDLQSPAKIIVAGNFRIESMNLLHFLRTSFKVYLIAVTLGNKLEDRIKSLQNTGEMARAVIVDAIGSETVDVACAALHRNVRDNESRRGFRTTGRFSPGYGDWQLEGQVAFVRLLDMAKIGITLTDRYMMRPRKSITAVTGVYDAGDV